MNGLDPALIGLVRSLARIAVAEALEEERMNPPDRTSGIPVEVKTAHRARRGKSDEAALRHAIEAAIAAVPHPSARSYSRTEG